MATQKRVAFLIMNKKLMVAEIQLKYLPTDINRRDLGKINHPPDAYEFIYSLYNLDTIGLFETFVVVFLNKGARIIGYNIHSNGSIDGTLVDVRLLVATALQCGCTSVIVSHNHPSGNLAASNKDKVLTKQLVKAFELFNIQLMDHLIVVPTKQKYFSFVDNGLL